MKSVTVMAVAEASLASDAPGRCHRLFFFLFFV